MDHKGTQVSETSLTPDLNRVPGQFRHIHLMGICGTGMASLAGMLQEQGFHVTGSDQDVYPPMSLFLENLSIPVNEGYRPENLRPRPDLVIVGNVVTRDNPEALELSRSKIPYLSFPQALRRFALKGKRSIVVSGTHGKTTTTALVAWILESAGKKPGFMVGGIPKNFKKNFRLGKGSDFVVEGDEYDSAFFDKGPKFLHYGARMAILTGIEFDHADIYRDLTHLTRSFRKFIDLIPDQGLLVANVDNPVVAEEIKRAGCRVATYSLSGHSQWSAVDLGFHEGLSRFRILKEGRKYLELSTPLYGTHNMSNLLSAVVLAHHMEIAFPILAKAARSFQGVVRRQELVGEKRGITILDDFAHHPTAVKATIGAVRRRYGNRRLVAVFEPRSNSSRRNVFQKRYALSFDDADLVMVPEPSRVEKIPPGDRFSSRELADDLGARGIKALCFKHTENLLQALVQEVKRGDVVLIMSNGSFDNLPRRLLKSL